MSGDKFCSYLRVSTRAQRASGLGIEDQRERIRAYVKAVRRQMI